MVQKYGFFPWDFFEFFKTGILKFLGDHISAQQKPSRLVSEAVTHCGVLLLAKIKVKYTTTYVFQGPLLNFSEQLFNRDFFLFLKSKLWCNRYLYNY